MCQTYSWFHVSTTLCCRRGFNGRTIALETFAVRQTILPVSIAYQGHWILRKSSCTDHPVLFGCTARSHRSVSTTCLARDEATDHVSHPPSYGSHSLYCLALGHLVCQVWLCMVHSGYWPSLCDHDDRPRLYSNSHQSRPDHSSQSYFWRRNFTYALLELWRSLCSCLYFTCLFSINSCG